MALARVSSITVGQALIVLWANSLGVRVVAPGMRPCLFALSCAAFSISAIDVETAGKFTIGLSLSAFPSTS